MYGVWVGAESEKAGLHYAKVMKTVREKADLRGLTDELGAEAMMMDALEKIEKELKKPLMRNDKKGMGLLMAEFDKINKKLGIRREDLPKYEEQLELKIAKAQLEELKKEAVEAMETQKKKRRKKMSCCEGRTRVQRRYHRRGKGGVACLNMCPEDRPNMSTVVLMLGGEGALTHQPKPPVFFTERNLLEAESSRSKNEPCSANMVTLTQLEPQ
ncbi:hypothetical protein TEA_019602 [Camellia sinensis var. sinensis]|uniref:S-locus receptor kinase C-terminal domain-containing protein n=1 Tax=Camellia sinensis var. sinensis TaxID=542762 RepID=A0A4S4EX40_CAMSN|nr:hypothetical protein TEA_019602 [Camellia sinensis var. sinensis]